MRILIVGGTRFIGVYLTQLLVERGHEVTLFNRGRNAPPVENVRQIQGDRRDASQLQQQLANEPFDAIFDNNGRELSDTQPLIDLFKDRVQRYVFVSSAGVYQASDQLPYREGDPIDPNSRHKGKYDTEAYCEQAGIPWTSVRPTYIYGPQNYNDVEAWFFDHIVRDRPVPIPGNGLHVTQLGHVRDLAEAMVAALSSDRAAGEVLNVSGERYVTFDGLARTCARAAGKAPEQLELVHYNPDQFDFGKRKAFPLRVQHFCADIGKATQLLDWAPRFDLLSGLKDSFQNDYLASRRHEAEVDFSLDERILAQAGAAQ
ncbi:MAG: 3-beta hydroxysteroid dehydrogenase [Cyanobacteria bacterium QS_8_64_29]|nr:MAG: 3-beta hydroxysteroid dehydrogenase [Cyanobacteria bacterium QS_8_64_29]